MASSDVQTYMQAFYESLLGKGVGQLRAAAPVLADLNTSRDVKGQIEKAIPADTLPEVKNFLFLLAQDNALDQLPHIVNALEMVSKGGSLTLPAEVTSAVPLSAAQRKTVTDALRQRYNAPLEMVFKIDETLIGGLIIRVGDQVLDNSLRSRLGMLQRNMMAS